MKLSVLAMEEKKSDIVEIPEPSAGQKKPEPETIGKKLRKFSIETRLKSSNDFKGKVLNLFKDYVKAIVVWGSVIRGDFTGKSDVDIYIIFDDTKMPLKKFDEIRNKIDDDIYKLAKETDPRLHVQPVIALTEFWDGIRTSHPLFYNIVREGYAIFDAGFFIPMRKLLEWGKFPATVEAAEIRFEGVPKRISRVKNVKTLMIAEDLYYAFTDAGQSVLMFIGIPPPPPKTLAREMRKHLVDTGLLEEQWAKMVEDVMTFRKAVEHKEIKDISGKDLDVWIENAEKYVERMEKLLDQLELSRKANDIKKNYEVMIKASVAALKALNKLPPEPEKLPDAFKKYLIDAGLVGPHYADVFGRVIEMRKLLEDKQMEKIPDRDVYMNKEYVRRFIMDVRGVIERIGVKNIDKEAFAEVEAQKKMDEARGSVETAKKVEHLPPEPVGEPSPATEKKLKKVEKKFAKSLAKHKPGKKKK